MSLASTQSDIDTALATLITNINSAQATYFAANGCYWQGLISHNTIPADGNSVAANNLSAVPSDQNVTWDTFMGVNKPGTLPAAVYVHTYKKPNGSQGYRIQKLFIYAAAFYSSTTDSGNDPSSAVSWGSDPLPTGSVGVPAPTYVSVSPTSGAAAGGTAITITGTGFQSGATVTVGGNAATSVTVVSSTSITCTTAAHAAGATDIVVTNIDSQTVTGSGAYTFSAASAPSIVQYKTGEKSNSGNLDIQLDSSTTAGNCIMLILRSNSGGTWSGLGAWTEVPDTGINGCRMYYRISAGGTISVSFDDDSAAKADEKVGIMFEITGNNATPIDASYSASPTGTCPDRTSTVDNCLVIRGGGSTDGSVDYESAPSGHTLLARVKRAAGSDVAAIAYKTQATAGAVGSAAWDAGTYSDGCSFTVVVKP